MRTYRFTIFLSALCLLGFTACDKYLDVVPKGFTLLNTVNDYDQWLNDPTLATNCPTQLDLLTDHVDNPTVPTPQTAPSDLAYTWSPQFYLDPGQTARPWGLHYANINHYNTVIQNVGKASGGTEQQKRALAAEALVGRAFEYFYLMNEYCQPYDATTATKDPGVPFVTSNDVTQVVPPRGTVQQVYDQIIADINTALPDLPVDNSKNRLRPDLGSAYSILARIYFYARDYANAAKNARLSLQNTKAVMLEFNNLPSADNANNLLISLRPDVIYGRQTGATESSVSLTYLRSFDRNDLRFQLFYTVDNYMARGSTLYYPQITLPYFKYSNYGTSVQEMKLIIAEVAARNGDMTSALQQLNDIRVRRFASGDYVPLGSSNPDTVLNWVLRERNFEFPMHGLRWFDMRRLDKEGRMPDLYRYDAQGNIIATLTAQSPKYTLQIPQQELNLNPGIQQNPY